LSCCNLHLEPFLEIGSAYLYSKPVPKSGLKHVRLSAIGSNAIIMARPQE
jgi:hypothetical protein